MQPTITPNAVEQQEELVRAISAPLLLYVLGTGLQGLIAGDVTVRPSGILVCIAMLAVGLGLYFVNNLARRRLDSSRDGRGGS